ncbi:MAG: peptide deformylase [Pirellulaceae bacterium]
MKIITYPHPTLRHPSKPVKRVDAELKQIVARMFELMYESNGVGLAANQVDLPLRLFVANLEADPEKGEPLVFINPVISRPKGSVEQEEGCLSLPGLYGPVIRPKQVRITAYTMSGEAIDATVSGLLARVVQHETDHLDGVLFFDRMPPSRQTKLRGPLSDFEAEFTNRRKVGEIPEDMELARRLTEWEQRYC